MDTDLRTLMEYLVGVAQQYSRGWMDKRERNLNRWVSEQTAEEDEIREHRGWSGIRASVEAIYAGWLLEIQSGRKVVMEGRATHPIEEALQTGYHHSLARLRQIEIYEGPSPERQRWTGLVNHARQLLNDMFGQFVLTEEDEGGYNVRETEY